jgi:excisionase family DNA binding protein
VGRQWCSFNVAVVIPAQHRRTTSFRDGFRTEVPAVSLEDLPEFLTVEEAAALLRVGRTSAYQLTQRWRATGGRSGLPVVPFGRQLRVPRAALARMADTPGAPA